MKTRFIGYVGWLLCLTAACTKSNRPDSTLSQRLNYVVADNYIFSYYDKAMKRAGLDTILGGAGSYTILLPNNDAFIAAGYTSPDVIGLTDTLLLRSLMSYHLMRGNVSFSGLPFGFNQPLQSIDGRQVFVTKVLKPDTIITVNGVKLLKNDIAASNGRVQVLSGIMAIPDAANLLDALANNFQLTYFSAAVRLARLEGLFQDSRPLTVFAPANAAFQAAGIPSLDSIYHMDTAVLAAIVRSHALPERNFISDFILRDNGTGTDSIMMISGRKIAVILTPDPVNPAVYNGITLQGAGNSSPVSMVAPYINLPEGNGVLHIVNQLIVP